MIACTYGQKGVPLHIEGSAYDFGHSIAAIQFTLDDGQNWTTYETPDTNDYQNVSWSFEYTPQQAGQYVLKVRSVNDAGICSPEAAFAELCVE